MTPPQDDGTAAQPAGAAWIVTGPTAGIGRRAALELSQHGTVVLVGRNPAKLADVESEIRDRGGSAVSVVCDMADLPSVRRAAAEIVGLDLPLAGLLNNAGVFPTSATRTAEGWDATFTTNHLGPFVLTEVLAQHLPDRAVAAFIVSAVEDPERRPAVLAGFRGARWVSAEASARGEWAPGGSSKPGFDAYATTKQANLATVFALARELSRLRVIAIEPGFSPGSDLGRDANLAARLLARYVLSPLAPMIKYWSTPTRAGRMIARVLTDPATVTGAYLDENGRPMHGSVQVSDPEFQDRVVSETRALLAQGPDRTG